MSEIVPAIIARDIEEVKKKLALIEGAAQWAQIDVMDSVFTPPVTFHDPAALRDITTAVRLEAHLMVAHPENSIGAWLDSPVARIVLHYESVSPEKLAELTAKINAAGKEAGIALKLETPISVLDPLFQVSGSKIHAVQLMGIAEIGYHGHPFDERVLEKARALHARYPDVILAVDGGVNERTIPLLSDAGVTRFIAGSAIYASKDPRQTIKAFEEIIKNSAA
ncbi:hypothetical protein HY839_00280 [Candidatus Azambacteria bacterium]|nr:hypothetical protein [Candidatus Azambacteria bacterium]